GGGGLKAPVPVCWNKPTSVLYQPAVRRVPLYEVQGRSMMLSCYNKPRLYVAVYEDGYMRDKEPVYHWDLITGPKTEMADPVPGLRYRVSHSPVHGWAYSERQVTNVRTPYNMLVRILIAKIEDKRRLSSILRSIPIAQDDPGFDTHVWVASALARIAEDGRVVGTADLDWGRIEATARGFVERKTAEGRFLRGDFDMPQPMWDLLENKEVLP
ncbi:Uncharacterized protein TCAP_05641, partial [Tolypocladium capitatum]